MAFQQHFKEELENPKTQYFILDSTDGGAHGDIDFVQYHWSRSMYNLVKDGDLFICRRPGKNSETGKFYFFGAAKIGNIVGDDRVIANLLKPYPFQEYLHPSDIDNFEWTWKKRGETWMYFFNQYGMNKIPKEDFINLIRYSEGDIDEDGYDAEAATSAAQSMQKEDYSVDDKEATTKIRAKQQAFSNKVKTNYGNKCAICSLSTRQFLIGSHIIPWKDRKDIRLDPANGICLCSLHDKAFDNGFITVDNNYKLLVSNRIKADQVLFKQLTIHISIKIHVPKTNPPDKVFLKYHRDNIFEKFK